jgi:hypothetical protein
VSRPMPIKAITPLPNVPETWLPHVVRGTGRSEQRTPFMPPLRRTNWVSGSHFEDVRPTRLNH